VYYYLDPFGCVKNQVDAETMMAVLNGSGWSPADDPGEADLIIINSCGFIESAKRESVNAVLGYRKLYPHKRILLAGCLAQRYGPELAEILTEADFFFGNRDLWKIGEAASRTMNNSGEKTLLPPDAGVSVHQAPDGGRPLLSLPGSAYVKIAEGCNNRCSFCAIPLIRGPLRSRPIPQVVRECEALLRRGIGELCLIGQDLGSYGSEPGFRGGLPELLEAISALPGKFWVRLLYIHPDHFPRPILELCRADERFLPYFDIPFQHGSARLLRAMNRRGDGKTYLSLIEEIRTILPDSTIRSTFLTGFPGETREDFEALLDFQAQARLDWLGVFTYSREEGTPAYTMGGRVAKPLAAERKRLLEERQIPITEKRMDRFVGRTLDVLVEEAVQNPPAEPWAAPETGLYLGRLACQAPEADGSAVITTEKALIPGSFIRARIFGRSGFDLEGAALMENGRGVSPRR
jgi:ribosomal protein S12 methylthiotransferase